MEFVNGRTLKEVLAAEGRLMPRRALEITADICAALEFSHRHGIIHRDIKPGNVMLTQNGQVKVMDFGIARALASGATTMTQTSRGHRHRAVPLAGAGPRRGRRRPLRRLRRPAACSSSCSAGTRRSSATARSAWPTSTSGRTRGRRARSTATCTPADRRDRAQGAGEEPGQPLPERRRDARRHAARRRRPAGAGHAGDARRTTHADGRGRDGRPPPHRAADPHRRRPGSATRAAAGRRRG